MKLIQLSLAYLSRLWMEKVLRNTLLKEKILQNYGEFMHGALNKSGILLIPFVIRDESLNLIET